MQEFSKRELEKLYIPPAGSHKGENGKVLIVAGSKLFHAPAIWPAEIASRIVDMVYVASTPENNKILHELKCKFWDGIVVRRSDLDSYAEEADCILIGPGLPRKEGQQEGDDDSRELTKRVLTRFKEKQFVIDGGALQCMDVAWIPSGVILTPHRGEWKRLNVVMPFTVPAGRQVASEKKDVSINDAMNRITTNMVKEFAQKHNCVVLLKGQEDIVCSPTKCRVVKGGNPGMTKGGTGDVLAGLVAALACKSDPFLAAAASSYLNKVAGDALYKRMGYYYNSSDLVREVPKVMKKFIKG